jgi:hypothetical protein
LLEQALFDTHTSQLPQVAPARNFYSLFADLPFFVRPISLTKLTLFVLAALAVRNGRSFSHTIRKWEKGSQNRLLSVLSMSQRILF